MLLLRHKAGTRLALFNCAGSDRRFRDELGEQKGVGRKHDVSLYFCLASLCPAFETMIGAFARRPLSDWRHEI